MTAARKPLYDRARRRPFFEYDRSRIGFCLCIGAQHDSEHWQPDVWLQIGPFFVGIGIEYS